MKNKWMFNIEIRDEPGIYGQSICMTIRNEKLDKYRYVLTELTPEERVEPKAVFKIKSLVQKIIDDLIIQECKR